MFYSFESDASHYVGIPQGGYGLTNATSDRPILFTCQIVTCIAVSIYDSNKRIGALLHVDSMTLIEQTFEKLAKDFRRNSVDLKAVAVSVIGGYARESTAVAHAIRRMLTQHFHGNINEQLFSKQALLNDEAFDLSMHFRQWEKAKDVVAQQPLIKRINDYLDKFCFTQIALDTRTGDVIHTSQYDYLMVIQRSPLPYSKQANDLFHKLVERGNERVQLSQDPSLLSLTDYERECYLKQFDVRLTKVYDSTKINKGYFFNQPG